MFYPLPPANLFCAAAPWQPLLDLFFGRRGGRRSALPPVPPLRLPATCLILVLSLCVSSVSVRLYRFSTPLVPSLCIIVPPGGGAAGRVVRYRLYQLSCRVAAAASPAVCPRVRSALGLSPLSSLLLRSYTSQSLNVAVKCHRRLLRTRGAWCVAGVAGVLARRTSLSLLPHSSVCVPRCLAVAWRSFSCVSLVFVELCVARLVAGHESVAFRAPVSFLVGRPPSQLFLVFVCLRLRSSFDG